MDVPVIDRPAHLAHDTAPVSGAVRHAVETIRATEDVVVILYANVPVRPDGLIDRAVRRLRESGADSVQSYAAVEKHHPYWMVALDEDGHVAAHHPNRVDRRQDLPPLFLPDGGVIAVARASLLAAPAGDPHAFLGRDRRGIETAPGSVIDIDGPRDLLVAEAVLERQTPAGAAR